MRKIVGSMVVLVLCAAVVSAQTERLEPVRISALKANVPAHLNEVVRLDGFVTQLVDSGARSTSFFFLKDDWGSVIKVRTSNQVPSVGKRYSIVGPLSIDPRSKDLYISEERRQEIFKGVEPWIDITEKANVSPPARDASSASSPTTGIEKATPPNATSGDGASTTTGDRPAQPSGDGKKLTTYFVIGGAALLVLAIVFFLVLRSRGEESQTSDYSLAAATAATAEPAPAPEQVIEGRTIKMHAPPPNTVKLLPGWFEVVSGDEIVKQIRFYKLGGEHGAETTFGRATGRPYAHIQLKAATVSSRQAKVSFDNGAARLTNFASSDSNPTRHNGRDLDVNESVALKETDRVEMGEISLLFHEAPSSPSVVRA